jgi:hypothetical protein
MTNSIAVSRAADSTTSVARAFGVVNGFLERDPTGEIITAVRHFPAREAQWAEFPGWTHADLVAAYAAKGIHRPYTHADSVRQDFVLQPADSERDPGK